jgi:nucleoid DNA-binding protein
MAKKIIKKTATKPVTEDVEVEVKAEKKVEKKIATPKVEKKNLANISTCDDLYGLIREKFIEKYNENITKEDVIKVMTSFQEAFTDFCTNSDADKAQFILPNIGSFKVFIAKAHESINPRTQEKIQVPDKKRISFKAYPRFSKKINGIEE